MHGTADQLALDLHLLPDRIEDTVAGSEIGRLWVAAQTRWSEYLQLKRRLDAGHTLAPVEHARLRSLVLVAESDAVNAEVLG